MNSEERQKLDDQQMLFTIMIALLKRDGGEIRISEDEMDEVTKSDLLLMYHDKASKELVLSMKLLNDHLNQQVH
mgnify:CR=1 FL=1